MNGKHSSEHNPPPMTSPYHVSDVTDHSPPTKRNPPLQAPPPPPISQPSRNPTYSANNTYSYPKSESNWKNGVSRWEYRTMIFLCMLEFVLALVICLLGVWCSRENAEYCPYYSAIWTSIVFLVNSVVGIVAAKLSAHKIYLAHLILSLVSIMLCIIGCILSARYYDAYCVIGVHDTNRISHIYSRTAHYNFRQCLFALKTGLAVNSIQFLLTAFIDYRFLLSFRQISLAITTTGNLKRRRNAAAELLGVESNADHASTCLRTDVENGDLEALQVPPMKKLALGYGDSRYAWPSATDLGALQMTNNYLSQISTHPTVATSSPVNGTQAGIYGQILAMMHQHQQHAATVAALTQTPTPNLGLLTTNQVLSLSNPLMSGLIGQANSSANSLIAPLAGAPLLMNPTTNRLKATADSPTEKRIDPNAFFNVFVGDLSPEVDNEVLTRAFEKFGEIVEAKVMRDPQSLKSRSFGFVAYARQEDAARAIEKMNGQPVGKRQIRTNWATRRTNAESRRTTYEDVLKAADGENTSVYVGNIGTEISEADLRTNFERFGTIKQVRLFSPKNFGFVVFENTKEAARAILEMSGQEIRNQTITCSWGRTPKILNPGIGIGTMNTNTVGTHLPTFPTALLPHLYQSTPFLQPWHV
ncbi:hypothetical protein M3Y94_00317200 [Aphelenchoides besseyi]|nr:hypothetical protein M3Y94_00317200 [Aphelenchoides besseyi]